ncbi:ATP-grasp domain-containing protein [Risungbinella massiliensis]|uniref:ATP-grasp domain-containing protein n=1 Tax=Risungbinella massiliensis TaxID=1329796 RepID=UPI0005CC787F|nr:ATP-grasp domain-containing protein [Risungbinella massiliensis]
MSTKEQTFLLTGGRAPATLHFARLLSKAGHRVLVAESNSVHLCKKSKAVSKTFSVPAPRFEPEKFIQSLEAIIVTEHVDHLVPMCEEVFTVGKYYNVLANRCKVWTESGDKLQKVHNKWLFLKEAEGLGNRIPETYLICTQEELIEKVGSFSANRSWILKPVYSRFASKVVFIQNGEVSLDDYVEITPAFPWLLQEYLLGKQFCTYSVADHGKLLAHATYQTTFTAGIGSSITFQPTEQPELKRDITDWVSKHGWSGQIAFDWIYTSSGEWVPIECNPRATSGIHLFMEKDQLELAFTKQELNQVIAPSPRTKQMLSLAMLTYGLANCQSFAQVWDWLKTLSRFRDAVFRWNDPIPFFYQLPVLYFMWKQSINHRIPMTEVSTYDIEWNGD